MTQIAQVPLDAAIKMTFPSNVAARATKHLFLNEKTADFHFVFDSNNDQPIKLPVHKIILAAASPVFHTMFYGSLEEKTKVEIVDVSFEAFKEFLQYFYLADVTLTMEHVPGVMYLGEKYEVTECLDACSTFLMQNLTADTVCWAYELAILFKCEELMEFCDTLTKCKTSTVLQSKCFLECDQKVLCHILKLDPLSGPNTDVLKACIAWAKAACQWKGLDDDQPQNVRDQLGQAFYEMPFDTLTQVDFFNIMPSIGELFEKNDFLDLIRMIASTEFQPKKFVKKFPSGESIESNEDVTIECNRIIRDSFLIKNIETTTISSSKPLLLKGFSCGKIYEYDTEDGHLFKADLPASKVTITKKYHDHTKKENSSEILFNGETTLNSDAENQVDLPSSILIKPGIKYEICLQQEAPPLHYAFNTLKPLLRLEPDVEIRFQSDTKMDSDNTLTGLVAGLSVERLKTVTNCDFVY